MGKFLFARLQYCQKLNIQAFYFYKLFEVKIEKNMECFDFSGWDGEWY